MNTTDWFVGSASRSINPDATERAAQGTFATINTPLMVHAIGFRGEDCLLAIVVCDIREPDRIDLSSVRFHINLHPITPVEVIIIASGTSAAPAYTATSAAYQHQVVHAITDSVIDALTFGCPAVMRVTPHAIQWRKFDELPIATLTFHAAGTQLSGADQTALIQQCHAPVLCVTHAHYAAPIPITQLLHDIATASKQAVTQVRWRHDGPEWSLQVNDVVMRFVPARTSGAVAAHTIAIDPHGPAR